MLTSITPLGERGRGQRWWLTASWLTFGHLLGGLVLGLGLAGVGVALHAAVGDLGTVAEVRVIAAAMLAAALFDLAGGRLPGRRQVDERWLGTYRGWVYGVGFGFQLGLGFVTVVNTALFVAFVVGGALVGGPAAIGLGVVYGAVRALLAIANARVRSVEQLKRLHRRLDRAASGVRIGGAGLVAAVAAGAVVVA